MRKRNGIVVVQGFMVLLFVALIMATPFISYMTLDETIFTVEDKERIVSQESSYYLVFTDNGVYKNTDSLLQLKFNSSDLQGQLKRGKTYTCTKNYWRVPFLSMYENLLECKEVK